MTKIQTMIFSGKASKYLLP